MNPSNPLYTHASQLYEYGIKLVKKFMQSEKYYEFRRKIKSIDDEISKTETEYRIKIDALYNERSKKIRELKAAKHNIEFNEIPKAKDDFVRGSINSYKMYLRLKDIGDHSFETYLRVLNEMQNRG